MLHKTAKEYFCVNCTRYPNYLRAMRVFSFVFDPANNSDLSVEDIWTANWMWTKGKGHFAR